MDNGREAENLAGSPREGVPTDGIGPKRTLTKAEAAMLLNVSGQYLARLCSEGRLPYLWEGAHHRLALDDVLAYRSRRDKERDVKFAELVRRSAEAGEYELTIEWPPDGAGL